jgi:hypothetical protein
VFAGTDRGGVFEWDSKTSKWVSLGKPGLPIVPTRAGHFTTDIRALAHDGGKIYAATKYGVFRKNPNAKDEVWEVVRQGLVDAEVNALTINAKNNVVAGTMRGAYELASNGKSWTAYGDLPNEDVRVLSLIGDKVFLATKTSGGRSGKVKVGG